MKKYSEFLATATREYKKNYIYVCVFTKNTVYDLYMSYKQKHRICICIEKNTVLDHNGRLWIISQ